ncbi:hypothetical protein AKO1_006075 [Acrasis kona]|uniref:Uncharacterized protein n=1 Tax=Acrasis kona TaxID=1008807 RepID=A0AAW2YHW8_9EUKA
MTEIKIEKQTAFTDGQLNYWQILEMQGKLEPRTEDGKLDNVVLGQLTVSTKSEKDKQIRAELVIGKQRCEGKQVQLKKPYVVLKKKQSSEGGDTEYEIIAVVKDKYLFRHRPTPLSPSQQSPTSSPKKRSDNVREVIPLTPQKTPPKDNLEKLSPAKPVKLAFEQLFSPKKK